MADSKADAGRACFGWARTCSMPMDEQPTLVCFVFGRNDTPGPAWTIGGESYLYCVYGTREEIDRIVADYNAFRASPEFNTMTAKNAVDHILMESGVSWHRALGRIPCCKDVKIVHA